MGRGISGGLTAVVAVVALLLPAAASGGPVSRAHAPILGVVPHAGAQAPSLMNALGTSSPMDLSYHGGPVMQTNATYAVYWIPSSSTACGGSPCRFDANYESLINQYFGNVAAASASATNVYSTDTQYYDTTGPIAYQSTFAGSVVDTNPFPASGCSDGVDAVCLTDQQIETELQNVLTAKGWHGSQTNMFFVMTPDGVGSCFDSSGAQCTTNAYCAYHSAFTDSNGEPVIYANEPYDATILGCTDGTSPNGDDADAEINTISHEHNEAITDPWDTGWWTNDPDPSINGMEIGDLCAWNFGTPLGGTIGVDAYNQVINGHHYWLQQEYSNDGSACVQHFGIPVNVDAPTVSGVAAQGHTLSTTQGVWSKSPTGFTYQWQRCSAAGTGCVNISGAAAATYTATSADDGDTLRSTVSAQNVNGSSTFVPSSPTGVIVPVPAATSAPVVSGTAAVGKTLTTTRGGWNTAATFSYQWQRCAANGTGCVAIAGATASTHPLVAADAGHRLEAVVSATNIAGTGRASSAITATVVAAPTSSSAPQISGRAVVGKTLSATQGGWLSSPSSFGVQWLRCSRSGTGCAAIPGATSATYRVVAADSAHRLKVVVAATNAAGTGSASSAATAVVIAVPSSTMAPRIKGRAKVGKRLTATRGRWAGLPASYRFQWLRCSKSGAKCKAIKKATHTRYRVTKQDARQRLRVRVTARNAAGSHRATSRATRRVPALHRG